MRLRSSRSAAAEANEPPAEPPTITTRQTKRRTKSRKAESVDASQPRAAVAVSASTLPPHQPEVDPKSPQCEPDTSPAAVTCPHPAESPLFNAEAAAEATQMAEALLSSTPLSDKPCVASTSPAARLPQQPRRNISRSDTEGLRPSSGPSAIEEQACSASGQGSKAAAHQANLSTFSEPKQANDGEQETEAPTSIAVCQSKTECSACPLGPTEQLGMQDHPKEAEAAQKQGHGGLQGMTRGGPILRAASREYTQSPFAEALAHRSAERCRVTGRASLALQSRRVSRAGSTEAFERGRLFYWLTLSQEIPAASGRHMLMIMHGVLCSQNVKAAFHCVILFLSSNDKVHTHCRAQERHMAGLSRCKAGQH